MRQKEALRLNQIRSTIYSVRVSKGDDFDTAYIKITIDESCSSTLNKEMLMYPNPTNGILNLDLFGFQDNTIVQLYSLNGAMIYSYNIKNSDSSDFMKHTVDLSRFRKGVYILRVANNGEVESKKVLHI